MLILERYIETIESLYDFDSSLVENPWFVPLLSYIFTIPTSHLLF
jgi:hypothetical protein